MSLKPLLIPSSKESAFDFVGIHFCFHFIDFYSSFFQPLPLPFPLEIRPTSLFQPPDPEHREGTLKRLTEGCAPAWVVFVQIMAKCVPAAPHTHHHMVPEDLQGPRVRLMEEWSVSPIPGPACRLPACTPMHVHTHMQMLPFTRV